MQLSRDLVQMNAQELRDLGATLLAQLADRCDQLNGEASDAQLASRDEELKRKQLKIDQLTHEMAILKRWRFARRSEQLDPAQRSLLEESIDEDLEAIGLEIAALRERPKRAEPPKDKPRRTTLPAHLPRREIRHDPENTVCSCGCQLERIGEDVSEKLDYIPGVFQVERHVRGKWVCRGCERLIQAPVPAQIIDKGIPTAGLLAHVLVSEISGPTTTALPSGGLLRACRITAAAPGRLGQLTGYACGGEVCAVGLWPEGGTAQPHRVARR